MKLNLVRALNEDTRVSPFTSLFLHWARQLFLGIPPFVTVTPGNICLLDESCSTLVFQALLKIFTSN